MGLRRCGRRVAQQEAIGLISSLAKFSQHGAIIVTAAVAGWLVSLTGIPLGWMIGSMLVTIAGSLKQFPVKLPGPMLDLVRATVGVMLGASFTHELLSSFGAWWVSLAFLLLALGIMYVLGVYLLRRISRFDALTASLCAMPGGIAEMVLLSEQKGADQARVAIVHALRIALAILLIPLLINLIADFEVIPPEAQTQLASITFTDWVWIIGCIVAGMLVRGRVKLPAPIVVVPMIFSAAVHLLGWTEFEIPVSVTTLVQVFIGINVGARFSGVPIKALIAALGAAAMVVALQIFVAFSGALAVANVLETDPVALVLAYSPGGLAEMSIIAVSVGRDVAFVGVHHIFRVLAALVLAPVLVAALSKRDIKH
ncbi:AbrB family transcriptional regulator [Ruegeria faecimaris]|uniref:AbrB family transcriptional regulator n=1 Tax=Ruegeria faecimaris TaxID=686389 RepID=UPI0024914612|nr:AbrB family transcriptional regulator [Ruegeria faecimaris]